MRDGAQGNSACQGGCQSGDKLISDSTNAHTDQAVAILNYLLGDVVAAVEVRRLYLSTGQANASAAVSRMALSYLFLTLDKWIEFYERFGRVIPEDCREPAKVLKKEIEQRGIRRFRNTFVGHIWDKKRARPLTADEVAEAADAIVKGDEDAFCRWCNDPDGNVYPNTVVSVIERTRDRLSQEYRK